MSKEMWLAAHEQIMTGLEDALAGQDEGNVEAALSELLLNEDFVSPRVLSHVLNDVAQKLHKQGRKG